MLNGVPLRTVMSRPSIQAVFPGRLRAARLALGISQSELGRRIGLTPEVASSRVNRYETGRHLPDMETARKLAKELDVPVAAFLAESEALAEVIRRFDKADDELQARVLALLRKD